MEKVAPTGNSPTYMTLEDMKVGVGAIMATTFPFRLVSSSEYRPAATSSILQRVMPLWLNLSMVVYQDPPAKKVWGGCENMGACHRTL